MKSTEERKKQERIKLLDKIIADEKDWYKKIKLIVRKFCLWLYQNE